MRLPSGEIAGELGVVRRYQSLNVNARPVCAMAADSGSTSAVATRRVTRVVISNLRFGASARSLARVVSGSLGGRALLFRPSHKAPWQYRLLSPITNERASVEARPPETRGAMPGVSPTD